MKFYAILLFITTAYAAKVFHVESSAGYYKLSYHGAHEECKLYGGHLATAAELEELRQTDYSYCKCGWTLDRVAMYPMAAADAKCGVGPGLHICNWRSEGLYNAWCYIGDSIENCSSPLGVELNNGIHYSQLQASSEFRSWWPIFSSSRWSAQIARLHNTDLVNAWVPARNHRGEYLEVDLDEPTAVTGLVTQGASRLGRQMWVTEYKVKYSKDGVNYKVITEDGETKHFEGNNNNNGLKRNMFPKPVLTRYIRIYPIRYHNDMALRIEVLGCDMEIYKAVQAKSSGAEETTNIVREKAPARDIFLERPPPDQ